MSNFSPTATAFGIECFPQAGYSSSYELDSRDQTREWDFMQALLQEYYPLGWLPDSETHDPDMGLLPPPDETRLTPATTAPVAASTPTSPVPGEQAPSLPVNNSFFNPPASPRDVPSHLQALRTELEADEWFTPLKSPLPSVPEPDSTHGASSSPPVLNDSQSEDSGNDGTSSAGELTLEGSPPDIEAEDSFAPLSPPSTSTAPKLTTDEPGVDSELPVDGFRIPHAQQTLLSLPQPATEAELPLPISPVSDDQCITPSSDSYDSLFTPPPQTPPELPQLPAHLAPGVPSSPSSPSQLPFTPGVEGKPPIDPQAQLSRLSLPMPTLGVVPTQPPILYPITNGVQAPVPPMLPVTQQQFTANLPTSQAPANIVPALQHFNYPYNINVPPPPMMFGHNLNSHFGFYSPHPGYIAPNFIRAPHAVYPTHPPPPPVVSAPVHFVATQPGGPSTLLPTSSLPAHVPRTALATNVENIITAPAQPNTQLSRCKPDLFWNGLLTSPAFNCHWGGCSFKLTTQRLETDDEYHLLAVQHLKGHLNSDEHIYRVDKTTWQCLWHNCGRVFNDKTVKNLRRHIFSNKHESDSVVVNHFCPVPACNQSFSRDYEAVAHLRKSHPGVPIPEKSTEPKKRQGENASEEPPAKRQRV